MDNPLFKKHVTFLKVRRHRHDARHPLPATGSTVALERSLRLVSRLLLAGAFMGAQGFSTAERIWKEVKQAADQAKSVLVLLDSLHSNWNVLVSGALMGWGTEREDLLLSRRVARSPWR